MYININKYIYTYVYITGKAGTEPRTVNLNHWNQNRQTGKAETELEIRNRLEPEPGKICKLINV